MCNQSYEAVFLFIVAFIVMLSATNKNEQILLNQKTKKNNIDRKLPV